MKKIIIAVAALCSFVMSPAHALLPECKIDRIRLTDVETVIPAVGVDANGRFLAKELITTVATLPLGPALKSTKYLKSSFYTGELAFVGEKVISAPFKLLFDSSLDALITSADSALSQQDDLIVRVNGVRVIPELSSQKYQPMLKGTRAPGGFYPALYSKTYVTTSFLNTATVQIIEYDIGSENDNLGEIEIIDEAGLEGAIEPINSDRVTINALLPLDSGDPENVSIYEMSYQVYPGEGRLEELPERLLCDHDECRDAREEIPDEFRGFIIQEIKACPAGYDFVGYTWENGDPFRVCELTPHIPTVATPEACGANFETRDDLHTDEFHALNDGDLITLHGFEMPSIVGDTYLGSPSGQYLASCTDCFPGKYDSEYIVDGFDIFGNPKVTIEDSYVPSYPHAAFTHIIDPNRRAAHWVVRILKNGKFALQGDNGQYLAQCENCSALLTGSWPFMNVPDPETDVTAQFTIDPLPSLNGTNVYTIKSHNGKYLSQCPGCVPGEFSHRQAAIFANSQTSLGYWEISVRPPTLVGPLGLPIAPGTDGDFSFNAGSRPFVKPTDTWRIEPGQTLTIDSDVILTVKGGGRIENYGVIINNGTILIDDTGRIENSSEITNNGLIKLSRSGRVVNSGVILNKEMIRLSDGIIVNGGIIDNQEANFLQNYGTVINNGYIYDPYDRFKGDDPDANPLSSGYVLGTGLLGERACRLMSGSLSGWDDVTETCTIESLSLLDYQTLEIIDNITLVVNGAINNEGYIDNRGIIDLSNGRLRQCGILDADGYGVSFPGPGQIQGSVPQDCVASTEETKCTDLGGSFVIGVQPDTGTCNIGSASVPAGYTLTIPADVTWNVTNFINNGAIIIEENGAMNITGGDFTNEDTSDGIINYGYFSVGYDDSFAVPFTFINDWSFDNHGTFDNSGNVIDSGAFTGNVSNRCGASYNLIRDFSIVTPPYANDPFSAPFHVDGAPHNIEYDDCVIPDSDGDSIADDVDDLPYDITETVDTDGDGYGDIEDLFPLNRLVYADADGDCGDLTSVTQTETLGTGCGDSDSDPNFRYSDAFPLNHLETADRDGDCGKIETQTITSGNGCGNNSDKFWLNPLETIDTDGDCGNTETQTLTWGNGCADNSDAFPDDPEEISDQDYDGVGDKTDAYPNDPENYRTITVDSSNGWSIKTGLFMANLIPDPLPNGASLSNGLANIKLVNGTVGSTVAITFSYDAPIDPALVWWKYGRTADNDTPHWYVFDDVVISGNTVTLTLTDGALGDDDLFANGSISDPGGLGMPEQIVIAPEASDDATSGGSSGGALNIWFLLMLFSLYLVKKPKNLKIPDHSISN